MALSLPDFPWDSLEPYRNTARQHPGGVIDLSIGSPIDATPDVARNALNAASNSPSYPLTAGSLELREAIAAWWERRRNTGPLSIHNVIPTIGSKEMVGLLPMLLGLRSSDAVVIPTIAYPTYAIGAHLMDAQIVVADDPDLWPENTKLVWLNSPGNPTGEVLSVEHLTKAVTKARELGAVLVSDECYAEMPWDVERVPSLLDQEVTEGNLHGLLALYSTSKQSNLAGYRAAVMAGDDDLIEQILLVRKHVGLIPPAPIQAALRAVLADDEHVAVQRERYRARRAVVSEAVSSAGFTIDHSEAGLYLWATRGENCWDTVAWCAARGLLVTPGVFYGEGGIQHVRIALTATDQDCVTAAERLSQR
jgi:succinyldiaminopimelate transaminase